MTSLQLEKIKKILKCFDMCILKPNVSILEAVEFTNTLQAFARTIVEIEKEMSEPKHLPEVVEDKPKEVANKK